MRTYSAASKHLYCSPITPCVTLVSVTLVIYTCMYGRGAKSRGTHANMMMGFMSQMMNNDEHEHG